MAEHSNGDDSDVDWNADDELEIDNFQLSPSSSPVHFMSKTSTGPDGKKSPNLIQKGISDEMFASFIEMGFSSEMIGRAIEETGGANLEPMMILETLFKYSASSEASSSKSKVIDHLTEMGFPEESVIKAIQEYGEENIDEITNALLSYAEAKKLHETEDEDIHSLSSDEENELNSSHEDSILKALIKMKYSKEEASIAIERCGEDASVEEVIDVIAAAQMARQFDESFAEPDEKEVISLSILKNLRHPSSFFLKHPSAILL